MATAGGNRKKNGWERVIPAAGGIGLFVFAASREIEGGLTFEFFASGSGVAAATLWQIQDGPTANYMEKFYAACRNTGRAADALRVAQFDSRNGGADALGSSFDVNANAFR